MKSRKYFIFLWAVMLAVFISGCGSTIPSPQGESSEQSSQVQPPAGQKPSGSEGAGQGPNTMRIVVYFATGDALHLAPEVRTVAKNDHPVKTSIELLLAGTSKPGLVSVIPKGTQLRALNVKDHVAYVDFNDKIVKNNPGGSATETLLVASIVNTLTEFPEIEKVQILVEGKQVDTITGHMDVSQPLSRSERIIKK
jgi:germination protein M